MREAFETAALLRNSRISADKLRERVDLVIDDLGLRARENAFIGGGEVSVCFGRFFIHESIQSSFLFKGTWIEWRRKEARFYRSGTVVDTEPTFAA